MKFNARPTLDAVWEAFAVFLKLGLTSFGGPIAHIGFFQQECIQRRKWVSDATYADLVALCQFLPGPASSQVSFALGYIRAGLLGAFAAWIGFTLPSALIMVGCAYGARFAVTGAGWSRGFMIAAVAVVAQAVWIMAIRLCPDYIRITIAFITACAVLLWGNTWVQIFLIGAGMMIGWRCLRNCFNESRNVNPRIENLGCIRYNVFAITNIVLYFALLVGLPLLSITFSNKWIMLADSFYRSGALVFGGGHVVLPLLEVETVGHGLLTRDEFLEGYGMAQALPGPLFSFAAYLGAIIMPNGPGWIAGLWCMIAMLLPSFLLVLGFLPYWQQLRKSPSAQAMLAGANAAVVGLLLAAFYQPVWTSAIDSLQSMLLALAAFVALQFWKLPPWLIVILCALNGAIFT